MSQPFHVAEVFTGLPGVFVKLEDTVRSFKEIVAGKHDDLPEAAFLMVGTIEQAREKAEKMKASASLEGRGWGNECHLRPDPQHSIKLGVLGAFLCPTGRGQPRYAQACCRTIRP